MLQRNDVLREIEAGELPGLLAAAEYRVFGAGETIIREGDEGDYFYHVYSGAVNVLKQGQVIARLAGRRFFRRDLPGHRGEVQRHGRGRRGKRRSSCVSSARFKQVVDMNEKMAMKLSAVITRRQEEMELFREKNLQADSGVSRKRTRKTCSRAS